MAKGRKQARNVRLLRGRADMSEWDLGVGEELDKLLGPVIDKAIAEAINLALRDNELDALFPYADSSNGKGDSIDDNRTVDPLDIDIVIPLHSPPDDMYLAAPTLTLNVRTILKSKFDFAVEYPDADESNHLLTIATALEALSTEIRSAIEGAK